MLLYFTAIKAMFACIELVLLCSSVSSLWLAFAIAQYEMIYQQMGMHAHLLNPNLLYVSVLRHLMNRLLPYVQRVATCKHCLLSMNLGSILRALPHSRWHDCAGLCAVQDSSSQQSHRLGIRQSPVQRHRAPNSWRPAPV